MKTIRKCAFCEKEFVARSGMQKYCSEQCQTKAKEARKKKQHDFINAVEPVIDVQSQEYLTFLKAAILMGCSRQYIYKLVNEGKLAASRISSRMAFIRKADIEQMLAGNPYHRVLPTSKPKKAKSSSSLSSKEKMTKGNGTKQPYSDEPLDYISGEEVMQIYKVKKSWLYTSAKRNEIPVCRIAGKNYYSRKHMDELFGLTFDADSIKEWVTTEQVLQLYGMNSGSIHSYAYRHHIPTKREYGITYYSKDHLDELRRTDLVSDDRYYTTAEVAEKYGMSTANVGVIVKARNLTKVKVGVRNLLLKEEIDGVMAERMAQFGSYIIA